MFVISHGCISKMATNNPSFFIGEKKDSDSLSSDSDGAAEDTDSLSSLGNDGMSCTSIDSMDSEDDEEGYLLSSVVSRRDFPISPEKQVTLPKNFLQVPTDKKMPDAVHKLWSPGAPPTCSVRASSALSGRIGSSCSLGDSNAVLSLDATGLLSTKVCIMHLS